MQFDTTYTLPYASDGQLPITDTRLGTTARMMSKAFLVAKSTRDDPNTILEQQAYFVDDTTGDAYINVFTAHRYKSDTTDHLMVQTLNRAMQIVDSKGI